MTDCPKIYLAGPEVFLAESQAVAETMKERCGAHGLAGVFPLDSALDLAGKPPAVQAKLIYQANIALIGQCAGVAANMSPFRGPSMDPGTAFEIGYAAALGKPVVGYASTEGDYLTRVRAWAGGTLRRDGGRWRDGQGWEVEDFGLSDNLMMGCAVRSVEDGFDAALRALRAAFDER
ncbi:nucleoside 2-deoxyribosyltransferase [Rhodospirillum rubrum]|uniref:nucleoside 2-deoxyribosyltransferase n=1 Tax=Rhodospirillum rubrum TaxID=1085 RepID=UPI001902F92F|nr:nucleoside 2-deoxyribosyltransferase [Rhodospirillum rubrum]MBK1663149.1 nucleoside 2-deoxyribosyltransferase [Rhodospirillum rubrum]MBK1675166.1 nucleoside 2-deoxyribosyltransferase [Rhodospirillum rubrum]